MQQTQLPRKPWEALPPPRDGLVSVRRAALRRRRRRAVVASLGGSVALAAVTVLLLLGGSGGLDVLQTNTPTTSSPAGVARPAQARPTSETSPHAATTTGGSSSRRHSTSGNPVSAGAASSASSHGPSPAPATSPVLVRAQSRQPADSANICPGAESGTTGGDVNSGLGWCFTAYAARASGGERLTVAACRDSTTGGTLTFDTTREVDLAVQRDGATVWDWGDEHPAQPSRHTLTTPANTCWDWSLVWPGITRSGASAGHGSFTFVATAAANELSGYPPQTVSFSY